MVEAYGHRESGEPMMQEGARMGSVCAARGALSASLILFTLLLPVAGQAQTTGTVEGVVRLGERQPAPRAEVRIVSLGLSTEVDSAGRFTFSAVPPGAYLIEAVVPGGNRAAERVTIERGDTARITLDVKAFFHLEEIVVSAGPVARTRDEAYRPADVVTGRDLVAAGEASLGESLSRRPGMSSSYAGPGASRPLIRGLGGDRVRILEAGIGTGDVSSSSPDHAVGVEPRSADRIEILRGPATLMYGGAALGGVVNVLPGSIARTIPSRRFTGEAEGLAGRVSGERTASVSVNAVAGPLVLYGSGLRRETGDVAIPGFAHQAAAVGDHPSEGDGEEPGVLANSALTTRSATGAATLVGSSGYVGASVTGLDSRYGVPAHQAQEGPVAIDLDKLRVDVEGTLRTRGGAFREVRTRLGRADYSHRELEGDEVGTSVAANSWEGRLEGLFGEDSDGTGAVGIHLRSRDLTILGDEVFVPPSKTRQAALFAFRGATLRPGLSAEAGLRYERQTSESPEQGLRRTDGGVSLSGSLNWKATEGVTLAASAARSAKLPTTEELFSNGPHAATLAFEIGDSGLRKEAAWQVDASAHVHNEVIEASASVFRSWFQDFIYQRSTGEVRDGLAVVRYDQADARFVGFEAEVAVDLLHHDGPADRHHVTVDGFADYVRASFAGDGGPLPRIPPLRIGGGVSYGDGALSVRGAITRVAAQKRVALNETMTDGYTMVDATASYRLMSGRLLHDLTLAARNLLDSEARVHTSFLKDVAPLPGREIRLVYRVSW